MPTDTTSIAQRASELKNTLVAQLPDGVRAALAADQASAAARGVPDTVARPGDTLPDGQLLDVHGEATSVTAQRHGRRAVVVFYRGAWCPYCNLALAAYQQQLLPVLAQRDIALIAISPERPDSALTMQEKNALSFTVLSDPGNQVASALGILTAPIEEARTAQRNLGLDLRQVNADGGYGLPIPTVVLADTDGIIRWIDVHPNYTTRTEVPAILAAVDQLA